MNSKFNGYNLMVIPDQPWAFFRETATPTLLPFLVQLVFLLLFTSTFMIPMKVDESASTFYLYFRTLGKSKSKK